MNRARHVLVLAALAAPLPAFAAPPSPVTVTIAQKPDPNTVVVTSHAKTAISEVCYELFYVEAGKQRIDWDCMDDELAPDDTSTLRIPMSCEHQAPPLTKVTIASVAFDNGKRWIAPVPAAKGAAPVVVVPTELAFGKSGSAKGSCILANVVRLQNRGTKAVASFGGEYLEHGKPQTLYMDLAHPIYPGEARPQSIDGTGFRITSLTFADGTEWKAP